MARRYANRTASLAMVRRLLSLVSLVMVLMVLALYARHVSRKFSSFTIDDAAISYAYANNLADGHGLRLTPNTNPVEGFSNPLEVLLLVPCRWLGQDLDRAAKTLNLGAVVLAAFFAALLLWRNLRGQARLWIAVPCAFAFLWPTFNHWIVAGLEGGLLCGLQMASVTLLALSFRQRWRDNALAAVALLLVLVRPEGIVYGALAVLGRMVLPGRRWRCAGIFFFGCVGIFVVRFALFRHWWPNTYYAKMHTQATFQAGVEYVGGFFYEYGAAYFLCGLPLFALLTSRTRIAALVAMAQVAFAVAFAVTTGGDWMRHWRFMQAMQGPYWMLCLLGLLALLSIRCRRWDAWWVSVRPNLVLLSLFPLAFFGFQGLGQRIRLPSTDHDVDMRKIAKVGALYRSLGDRLNLGRPLLIADVDVGGMSYPPGVDVLDMGGLGDITFGYSWTRRPSEIVDYFFDYRRPHTLHTHGGWVDGRPMHGLSPFDRDYRVMGQKLLDQLSVSWLTAIRADLVDPAAAPVAPRSERLGPTLVLGVSSLPDLEGQQVLFVHALQVGDAEPRELLVQTADGGVFPVGWHAQQDVRRGPLGAALLGMVRLPAGSLLPLTISPSGLQLTSWPSMEPELKSAEDLSRLPLYRLAGLPAPTCRPEDLLASYANPGARARGARLLADLCGGGLSRWQRLGLAEDIARHPPSLPLGDDRYDALRIFESLGLPTSTLQLGKIERASRQHNPYDEVSAVWAQRFLKSGSPTPMELRAGLGALVMARQYDKAILTALARGFTRVPEAREPLCLATRALGLQPYLLSQLACPDRDEARLRLVRQGFENPLDPTLQLGAAGRNWIVAEPPMARLGGQGRAMLFIPPCTSGRCPEVVWGPLPWPGRYFGALAAGARVGSSIVVEVQNGSRWVEVGHTNPPANEAMLAPVQVELRTVFPAEVRVRVSNHSRSRAMTVDALTFLDLD